MNDFTGADLEWTDFIQGVDLRAQRWPKGDVVILENIHERIAAVRAQVTEWQDEERRERALSLLDLRAARLGPEQRDVLFHRRRRGSDLPGELDELIEHVQV